MLISYDMQPYTKIIDLNQETIDLKEMLSKFSNKRYSRQHFAACFIKLIFKLRRMNK